MKIQLDVRDPSLNPLELMLVAQDLESRDIKYATAYRGNNCIWVHYGLVDCYYIFRDGHIADIQYD
jgi:hypothetical protein